ncbi:MAG: RNA-dependent DNA polymerase [Methylococcales bacterium]|nr:RNA-dependent DNA polymerase [Methylococcales bacterium]
MPDYFEQMCSFSNLHAAAKKAFKGKQKKSQVMSCVFNMEAEIFSLQEKLLSGEYQPQPYRYFTVQEPKKRDIAAAHIQDRIIHHALCNILGSTFESVMLENSFACRVNKGQHKAVKQAQYLSRQYHYVLKFDVRHFFASVDHQVMLSILSPLIQDKRLFKLCETIICYPLELAEAENKGLPIGNLTSQYFANLYLNELDWFIMEELNHAPFIRYMDDVLLFSDDKAALWQKLDAIQSFLCARLQLRLKPSMTQLMPVAEGFNYLGMRIFPALIRLQSKTKSRFIRRAKQSNRADEMKARIAHISHADTLQLRRKVFSDPIHLG